MTEIDSLESIIQDYFKGVIDHFGFRDVEKESYSRGALIKYSSDHVLIEFEYDRGIVSVGVAPPGADRTIGIESLSAYLALNKIEGTPSQADRKLIIATRMGYSDQAEFLLTRMKQIVLVLNENNYQRVRKEIENMSRERFGY